VKCPKTRPPLRSVSGKEIRPERPCPETLHDFRSDGFASCPYHGLVQVEVDDTIKANGKKKAKKKGKKDRG